MINQTKKRIGILGGSFDPVHNGHLGLARQVMEEFELDEIIFIPAYISPHKQDQQTASAHHRLAMLRLATEPFPCFRVSDMELQRGGVSYTVDTITTLKNLEPETDFFLIMGMDTFEGINTWKDTTHLLEMCHLIVAARPGHTLERTEKGIKKLFGGSSGPYMKLPKTHNLVVYQHAESKTTLNFFNLALMNVSSSEIREKINHNLEIKNMLPPEVENYIMQNQLYRAKSHP